MVYKWYILPIGWLHITYHLLREPETALTIEGTESNPHLMVNSLHLLTHHDPWYLESIAPKSIILGPEFLTTWDEFRRWFFLWFFEKRKKNTGKQIQLKRQIEESIWKFMMPLNSSKIFIAPLLPNRLALDQLNSSIHSFSRFNPKHKRFIDRMRHQDLRVLCGSANLTNGYLRMVAVWGPELHLWDIAHTIHVWYIYLHLP